MPDTRWMPQQGASWAPDNTTTQLSKGLWGNQVAPNTWWLSNGGVWNQNNDGSSDVYNLQQMPNGGDAGDGTMSSGEYHANPGQEVFGTGQGLQFKDVIAPIAATALAAFGAPMLAEGLGSMGGSGLVSGMDMAADAGASAWPGAMSQAGDGLASLGSQWGGDASGALGNVPAETSAYDYIPQAPSAADVGASTVDPSGYGLYGPGGATVAGDGVSGATLMDSLGNLGSSLKDAWNWSRSDLAGMKGLTPLGLAGSLYSAYSKNQTAQAQKGLYNQFANMYSPGSPEANLMQQEMDRKDAAAGRNSQYGTRAVELAAKIAQLKYANMGGLSSLQNGMLNNQNSTLAGLFGELGKSSAPTFLSQNYTLSDILNAVKGK